MSTVAITVSIGRNVRVAGKIEPMPINRWTRFVAGVEWLVEVHAQGTRFTTAYGRGEWDGVEEESVVVTGEVAASRIDEVIRPWLAYLAREYGQDAIALTVGTTDLIKPKE